jgi:hypothetical protein
MSMADVRRYKARVRTVVKVEERLCDARSSVTVVKEGAMNREQNHLGGREGEDRNQHRQLDEYGENLRGGPNQRAREYGRNLTSTRGRVAPTLTRGLGMLEGNTTEGQKKGGS